MSSCAELVTENIWIAHWMVDKMVDKVISLKIAPRDIVSFKSSVECLVARFCWKRNISGVVVKIKKDLCEIAISGFEYSVFTKIGDINLIAKCHEVPVLEEYE